MSLAGSSSLPPASPLPQQLPDPGVRPAYGLWHGPNVSGLWAEQNLLLQLELFDSLKSSIAKQRGLLLLLSVAEADHGSFIPASCRAPGSNPAAGRAAEVAGLASQHLTTDVLTQ